MQRSENLSTPHTSEVQNISTMYKVYSLPLLLLVLSILTTSNINATPVELPDLIIEGSSAIRSFVYKTELRPLLPDSTLYTLPTFYPSLQNVAKYKAFSKPIQKPNSSYLILGFSDNNSYLLDYNVYGNSGASPASTLLKHRLQFSQARSKQYYLDSDLYYQYSLYPGKKHAISQTYQKAEFMQHTQHELNLFYHQNRIGETSVISYDANTHLGFQYHIQISPLGNSDRLTPELKHHSLLQTDNLELRDQLMFLALNPGLYLDLQIRKWQETPLMRSIRPAILIDMYRITPTLVLDHEIAPSFSSSLHISNRPRMENLLPDLSEHYRWYELPKEKKITKIPLDLHFTYTEFSGEYFFDQIRLSNQSQISYDSPLVTGNTVLPIPTFVYRNQIINKSSIFASRQLKPWLSGEGELCYQWDRDISESKGLPYSPDVIISSSFKARFGAWNPRITLFQMYNTTDHKQDQMHDVLDLQLGVSYRVANTEMLLELKNILDFPMYRFVGQEKQGTSLSFTYSTRF